MTCCGICKIVKKESIEESKCGCPDITVRNDGSAMVSVRGYVFSLEDYLMIRSTANKNAKAKNKVRVFVDKPMVQKQ